MAESVEKQEDGNAKCSQKRGTKEIEGADQEIHKQFRKKKKAEARRQQQALMRVIDIYTH